MKRNYYSEAIDICTTDQHWKSIVLDIAKNHPSIVVNAANRINNNWSIEARALYVEQGELVKAIKVCRNATGMGLKEAKKAVESLA